MNSYFRAGRLASIVAVGLVRNHADRICALG
jgi:hypothetical protein